MLEKLATSSDNPTVAPGTGNDRVCAVIVAYIPDEGFEERLFAILPQVDLLVVVDNTPDGAAPWQPESLPDDRMLIRHVHNRTNLGIATALNQGLQHALEADFQWLLTLDQDTQCYPDMVQTLLQAATGCKPQPVVVGGNYFDAKRKRHDAPPDNPEGCIERKTVISSGCLVNVAFARTAGGFRDDYFIDQVDHEFCLRMRANDGRVVITSKPVMDHCVGGETGPRVPLVGMMLPNHSPLRKYYITRNTVATVAAYWRVEPEWCLRRAARLLMGLGSMVILEQNKLAKVRAFAFGLVDGMRGRMGPCKRKWLIPGPESEKTGVS